MPLCGRCRSESEIVGSDYYNGERDPNARIALDDGEVCDGCGLRKSTDLEEILAQIEAEAAELEDGFRAGMEHAVERVREQYTELDNG